MASVVYIVFKGRVREVYLYLFVREPSRFQHSMSIILMQIGQRKKKRTPTDLHKFSYSYCDVLNIKN